MPLFLSDPTGQPDPAEFIPYVGRRRTSISTRILALVLVAASTAMMFAMLSSDATKKMVLNVKASIAAALPTPSMAAQSDSSAAKAIDEPSKLTAAPPASANPGPVVQREVATAAEPTRNEITSAFRTALQNTPPAAPAPAAVAALASPKESSHRMDSNEIAASQRRAEALIASGDLAAARLVLRSAADAGDAQAMMTLGSTYDPAILNKLGVHGFVPDIVMARNWYEKAKNLGSGEAVQRLEILASEGR